MLVREIGCHPLVVMLGHRCAAPAMQHRSPNQNGGRRLFKRGLAAGSPKRARVLVIDIGGSHVKVFVPGRKKPVEIESGPRLTPGRMVAAVLKAIDGAEYERVSIGYPGRVSRGVIGENAPNLGKGWVRFDFQRAFKRPIRLLNDAAMQALGSYRGGRMLFLGLGTGLGSALVLHGTVHAMELGDLPCSEGSTYVEFVGKKAYQRVGKAVWSRRVKLAVRQLIAAIQPEYTVLGGGQAKRIGRPPAGVLLGDNSKARLGGLRVWQDTFKPRRPLAPR